MVLERDRLEAFGRLTFHFCILDHTLETVLSLLDEARSKQEQGGKSKKRKQIPAGQRVERLHDILDDPDMDYLKNEAIVLQVKSSLQQTNTVSRERNRIVHGQVIAENGQFVFQDRDTNKILNTDAKAINELAEAARRAASALHCSAGILRGFLSDASKIRDEIEQLLPDGFEPPAMPLVPIRTSVMDAINLRAKLGQIHDHWNPRIVAELNGQHVKLVKFQGEFVWHHHDHEDELFYVVRGEFRMDFRDRSVTVREGELIVVPRGVEHRPVAVTEVEVMLFEPASTLNTGNVRDERTRDELERL